jgi:DNA-binding protein HU-beta
MKKRELAQAVAAHTEVDPRVAARVIDGTLEVILATVAKGEDVALTGFAKFSKVKRPARMARNPATGEAVKVKAKTVAKITPLKGFKDVVLGVAAAPKLTKPTAAAVKKTAPVKKAAATTRTSAATAKKAAAIATPRKTRAATATTTSRTVTAARKASGTASTRRATRPT